MFLKSNFNDILTKRLQKIFIIESNFQDNEHPVDRAVALYVKASQRVDSGQIRAFATRIFDQLAVKNKIMFQLDSLREHT